MLHHGHQARVFRQTNTCKIIKMLNMVQMKHIKTGKTTVNLMELRRQRRGQLELVLDRMETAGAHPDSELAKCQRFKSASASTLTRFDGRALRSLIRCAWSLARACAFSAFFCARRLFSPVSQEKTFRDFPLKHNCDLLKPIGFRRPGSRFSAGLTYRRRSTGRC